MCSKSEMEFSIFLIHQMAEFWHKTPSEVYSILDSSNILAYYAYASTSDDAIKTMEEFINKK